MSAPPIPSRNPLRNTRHPREIDESMTRLQCDLDSSGLADYSGAPTPTCNTAEDIEARTVAWLDRGESVAPPPESDRSGNASLDTSVKSHMHPAYTLSPYPPTSPTTGRREYTSPLSPLNNGRDVYGNHIPTNTRDYFTAQSPPTSPLSKPTIRQTQEPVPHLRGGGGWWNSMQAGIGRGGKEQAAAQEQSPTSVQGSGNQSALASGAKRKELATVGEGIGPLDFDDYYSPNGHLSILDRRQGRSQPPVVSTGLQPVAHNDNRAPTNRFARDGQNPLSIHPALRPAAASNTLENLWEHTNQPTTFARDGSTSPKYNMSEASTSLRLEKKWNKEPATGPPGRAPPPPSQDVRSPRSAVSKIPIPISRYVRNPCDTNPAPNDSRRTRELTDSFPETPSQLGSPSRRPPSPVNTIDDDRWDLQSLQVGESVSVAGRYRPEYYATPRPTQLWPTARRPGNEPTREEIEAWMANANAKFRSRAQEIITPYNAEVVSLQRAQQLGQISKEHYIRQSRQVEENKKRKLRQAAQETGYAILEDEQAIIEAIQAEVKDDDYSDILSDPTPAVMPKVEEEHSDTRVVPQSEKSDESRTRNSSFDSGRKLAGKMFRFILAAPSDPELKTCSSSHSSHSVLGVAPVRVYTSMDGNGMNGLALAQNLDGLSALFRKKSKKNKGKGLANAPTAVHARDFASSGAVTPKLVGTTAVNKNGVWAATTARSATTERPRDTTVQASPSRGIQVATSIDVVTRQPTSYALSNVSNATHQTRWGEVDSHGHVYLPHERERQAGMRGGGSTKVKSKETQVKKPKDARPLANRAEAMHFLG